MDSIPDELRCGSWEHFAFTAGTKEPSNTLGKELGKNNIASAAEVLGGRSRGSQRQGCMRVQRPYLTL